ncbi:MAG: tail fiber protein [Caulobacter sp.]|nr:tail fiber protein [Caulobacter sp.]
MKTMIRAGAAALAMTAGLGCAAPAFAQAEPFLGQLALFGMNWCPKNWLPANGQTLSIQQNSALFSLLGVQYGGNGQTTFALPNLQGRAPVGASPTYPVGLSWGQASTTLTLQQMPAHTHLVMAASASPTTGSPAGGSLATFPNSQPIYAAASSTPDILMNQQIVSIAGGSMPFSTQSPVLAMSWCVSMSGVYPSRP